MEVEANDIDCARHSCINFKVNLKIFYMLPYFYNYKKKNR